MCVNYELCIRKLMDWGRNSVKLNLVVDSVIIEFKSNKKYNVNNEELFFKLVRDSFKYKRKNLKNNLKEYDLEKINNVLYKIGKDLTVRAEALTIEDFVFISNEL